MRYLGRQKIHFQFSVKYINDTRFSDYEKEPLLLLAHLVQEDFIIMEYDSDEDCWRFASGVAAFSFVELGINGERSFMKPGADVATIHTPVPGFNPNIYNQVSNYFKHSRATTHFGEQIGL